MFKINPDDIRETESKLLYNIWQELKRMNEAKPEPARPVAKATEGKAKVSIACKVCGEKFDNRGKFLSHSRKHKGGL
jgi:SHS2 domain-containing protein